MIFILQIDVPNGVSRARMKEYIETEIKAGVGMLEPSDPLFSLNENSVKVIEPKKEK